MESRTEKLSNSINNFNRLYPFKKSKSIPIKNLTVTKPELKPKNKNLISNQLEVYKDIATLELEILKILESELSILKTYIDFKSISCFFDEEFLLGGIYDDVSKINPSITCCGFIPYERFIAYLLKKYKTNYNVIFIPITTEDNKPLSNCSIENLISNFTKQHYNSSMLSIVEWLEINPDIKPEYIRLGKLDTDLTTLVELNNCSSLNYISFYGTLSSVSTKFNLLFKRDDFTIVQLKKH